MTGMSAQVQVGQKAVLTELENGFELTLVAGDQPGLVIADVQPDHVVLEDVAGGVLTRVPTYLIKAVHGLVAETLPSAA